MSKFEEVQLLEFEQFIKNELPFDNAKLGIEVIPSEDGCKWFASLITYRYDDNGYRLMDKVFSETGTSLIDALVNLQTVYQGRTLDYIDEKGEGGETK